MDKIEWEVIDTNRSLITKQRAKVKVHEVFSDRSVRKEDIKMCKEPQVVSLNIPQQTQMKHTPGHMPAPQAIPQPSMDPRLMMPVSMTPQTHMSLHSSPSKYE